MIYGNSFFIYILLSFIGITAFSQQIIYTNHNEQPNKLHDFSFVQITDIHLGEAASNGDYGSEGWLDEGALGEGGYSAVKLRKSVSWINKNADSLKIKFVIVTGDITDSGERSEFLTFKEIMDELKIPYVPVIGNHDVWPYTRHSESGTPCGDSLINVIFKEQFSKLSSSFKSWNDGTRLTRILNPETNNYNYLQNFSFKYNNYTFILSDFGTRHHAEIGELGVGPQADLHDFSGGTFQWLKTELEKNKNGSENVFLFTHWPMTKDPLVNKHLSSMAFGFSEYKKLAEMLYPYKANLAIWFSGHIHRDRLQYITKYGTSEEIATCIETASNKRLGDGHFRVVKVWD